MARYACRTNHRFLTPNGVHRAQTSNVDQLPRISCSPMYQSGREIADEQHLRPHLTNTKSSRLNHGKNPYTPQSRWLRPGFAFKIESNYGRQNRVIRKVRVVLHSNTDTRRIPSAGALDIANYRPVSPQLLDSIRQVGYSGRV